MRFHFSFLVAATIATGAVLPTAFPAAAAQYEKTGNWVFSSKAIATDGEAMLYACVASTESPEGVALTLSLAPAETGGFDAALSVGSSAWRFEDAPVRVGFEIGADHWVLPGEGTGRIVDVSWTGDAAFLTFIEDLASSSFAGLTGRDGAALAQFSLRGSRSAIEAMKACAEEQIGQELGAVFEARAADGSNPF